MVAKNFHVLSSLNFADLLHYIVIYWRKTIVKETCIRVAVTLAYYNESFATTTLTHYYVLPFLKLHHTMGIGYKLDAAPFSIFYVGKMSRVKCLSNPQGLYSSCSRLVFHTTVLAALIQQSS